MLKRACCLASLMIACLAGSAQAQVPSLVNGNLETVDPYLASFGLIQPQGWRKYNFTEYRQIGDGLLPETQTHSGTRSVRLPGGEGRGTGEFAAVHSEEQIQTDVPSSPRNWPEYTFNPASGQPITVSCWFNIPASDPVVKSRFGLKLGFLRSDDPVNGPNYSHFYDIEWLDVDPESATVFPGCVVETRTYAEGVRQVIHTNGQWLQMTRTVQQSQFPAVIDNPPTNPARCSMLALRFDIFPAGGSPAPYSRGTIWVDDLAFSQGSSCPADFNGTGGLTVADIFDFLNAWFASSPSADFNHTGGITVADIFDFLNAWFAGCP